MKVIQTSLGLLTELMEDIEEIEGEDCVWAFLRCWEPSHLKQLLPVVYSRHFGVGAGAELDMNFMETISVSNKQL